MQKGKPYSVIWSELKKYRTLTIFVHPHDVTKAKGNLTKNKHRDIVFNIEYPQARLSFIYSDISFALEVKLSLTLYDDIPIDQL